MRYFKRSDLDAYVPIVADPAVMAHVGGVQNRKQARLYLAETIALGARAGLGRYAVELRASSRLIGFCGFLPTGAYIDFGYRFARETWGQGIGLEAARRVRDYGLHDLDIQNMEAIAAVENRASVKILDKLGFKLRETAEYDGVPSVRFRDRIITADV
ncbi:MAG: GNAT family N-acetyltransferase [Pseudomonadota bacterium]